MKKFFLATLLSALLPSAASAADINVDGFKKILGNKDTVILDVRTDDEFRSGHIKGSINIDFYAADFEKKLAALDKSKTYAIYCRSGNRSGKAVRTMNKMGFQKLYNLIGGLSDRKNRAALNIVK